MHVTPYQDDVFLPESYRDIEKQVKANDIIIVASTGSKTIIGKAGYIDSVLDNTQIGAFLRIIRPLFAEIVPYIKLVFATKYYMDYISNQSGGTNINNIKTEHVAKLLIPIPSLSEQERVAFRVKNLFSKLDIIDSNQSDIETLYDELKKRTLDLAIRGKLVPQDENDEPASELLKRIRAEKKAQLGKKYVDSYIYKGDDNYYYEHIDRKAKDEAIEVPFDLPDNWCYARIETLVNLLTDGTHSTPKYTTNGIPFISVKDLSTGILSFESTKFISIEEHRKLSKRCNPCKGDILLTKVGTTGIPVLVDTEKEFSLFVSVALLKFDSSYINSEFFIFLLKSPLVQEQAAENTRGVGNKNWVLSDINKTLVVLPPLAEQRRIVNKINEIFAKL